MLILFIGLESITIHKVSVAKIQHKLSQGCVAQFKEQTKPNNSAETGAEAEVSASAIGSKRVVCKYSVPVKPKPN